MYSGLQNHLQVGAASPVVTQGSMWTSPRLRAEMGDSFLNPQNHFVDVLLASSQIEILGKDSQQVGVTNQTPEEP